MYTSNIKSIIFYYDLTLKGDILNEPFVIECFSTLTSFKRKWCQYIHQCVKDKQTALRWTLLTCPVLANMLTCCYVSHLLFYPRVVLLQELLLHLLPVLVVIELLSLPWLLGFRHVCDFSLFSQHSEGLIAARKKQRAATGSTRLLCSGHVTRNHAHFHIWPFSFEFFFN